MNEELTPHEQALIAAFKRGVEFRENTTAPVPADERIIEKLEIAGIIGGTHAAP